MHSPAEEETSPINAAFRLLTVASLLPLVLSLSACNLGIGVRIPGTPVSVGTSVPLKGNTRADNTRYLDLRIESTPPGADIYVDGVLSGSTPATISIPFEKAWFGRAKGSAQIALRRPGYLAEGVRVFAVGKEISRTTDGPPIDVLDLTLRPAP